MYSSSSSSCRTASTDILDPLSPLLPIFHRFWPVLRATSRILPELLYVGSIWSSCFCSAIGGGPLESITFELIPASPAVSCKSVSSNFDNFRDGGGAGDRTAAALWGVVSRNCSKLFTAFLCSCRQAFFSILFVSVHAMHPYSRMDTIAAWKKLHFILPVSIKIMNTRNS